MNDNREDRLSCHDAPFQCPFCSAQCIVGFVDEPRLQHPLAAALGVEPPPTNEWIIHSEPHCEGFEREGIWIDVDELRAAVREKRNAKIDVKRGSFVATPTPANRYTRLVSKARRSLMEDICPHCEKSVPHTAPDQFTCLKLQLTRVHAQRDQAIAIIRRQHREALKQRTFVEQRLERMSTAANMWASSRESFVMQLILLLEMQGDDVAARDLIGEMQERSPTVVEFRADLDDAFAKKAVQAARNRLVRLDAAKDYRKEQGDAAEMQAGFEAWRKADLSGNDNPAVRQLRAEGALRERAHIITWLRTDPNTWKGEAGEPLPECQYIRARFPSVIAGALERRDDD